jgi:signal peptidase I
VRQRPEAKETQAKPKPVRKRGKRFRWLVILLLILSVAFMGGSYLSKNYLDLIAVTGDNMASALQSGDVLVCLKEEQPARGDIVAFRLDGATMVRRIIALAGDEVNLPGDGKVYVNGIAQSETYLAIADTDPGDQSYPLIVPEGRVFVLADDRATAVDSRTAALGTVPVEDLLGIAELRIWPIYRIARL